MSISTQPRFTVIDLTGVRVMGAPASRPVRPVAVSMVEQRMLSRRIEQRSKLDLPPIQA